MPLTLFNALHLVLLFGFVGATAVLLLVTLAHRLRLRHVVRTWRGGPLFGLPLWPTAFLLGTLGGLLYVVTVGGPIPPILLGGYLAGSLFWFFATLLAQTVVLTEFGLVPNVQRAGRMIGWGQVADYFEYHDGARRGFAFFYLEGGVRQRFDLVVPARHLEAVREIVRAKLDARFEFSARQVFGKKALEG